MGKAGEVEEAEAAALLLNDPALLSPSETAVKWTQDPPGHAVTV